MVLSKKLNSQKTEKKVTAWQSWEEYRDAETFTTELPKGGDIPWALFYPADYAIGSSNLGIHYVFRLLREKGIAAERFFERPIPYRSVDADTMLERFPIITAGISYEGGALSFFNWLKGAGIPLSPIDRKKGDFPIVGAGGAITYINPLLLSGVCDFIVLGDALNVFDYLIECFRRYMLHSDRELLFNELAENKSILVPLIHIKNGFVANKRIPDKTMPMSDEYPMHSTWTTPKSIFGNTLLIELQRGCIRNCSYCTLPSSFGKMRFRSFDIIKEHLDEVLSKSNVTQVGLVTPEASDYPDLNKLIDYLEVRKMGISFASLRIDRLTERMITAQTCAGRHSITVAPETGLDALRLSCGKRFTNKTIIEKLSLAASKGVNQVKLYFMIGLPGETDEDIFAISELCHCIIEETGLSLILSVGAFVPKPGTPWQHQPFVGTSAIRKKYSAISSDLRTIKKKKPKLRLTSPKEAAEEFNLAWYGYNDSVELANAIEKNVPLKKHSSRESTLTELKFLW